MSASQFPVLPGLTYTSVKNEAFDTELQSSPNRYEVGIQQTINPIWTWTLIFDFLHDFYWSGAFAVVTELRTLQGFFAQMGGRAGSFLYSDPDDNSVGPALTSTPWKTGAYYPVGFSILGPSNHWQQVTVPGYSGGSAPAFSTSGGTVSEGPSSPQLTWKDKGGGFSGGAPNVPMAQLPLVSDGAGNWYSPVQRTLDGVFFEDVTDLNGSIAVYVDGVLASAGTSPGQYQLLGPGLALPGSSFMGMYIKWGVAAAAWQSGHAYALNATILDPAGHIQKATTAGTSGASIPTFNDSGSTTPDGAGTLVWTDQGAYTGPGATVTSQFNFFFRVRFDSDGQDFEKFLGAGAAAGQPPTGQGGGYWTIGGSEASQGSGTLKLTSRRPTPA